MRLALPDVLNEVALRVVHFESAGGGSMSRAVELGELTLRRLAAAGAGLPGSITQH